MTESDPTGYRDSPDTTDGPVGEDQTDGDAAQDGASLTTDDEAQTDDGVVRPGNEPD
jgi:hypothetical protein